jgi:hypothetical protein
MRNAPKFMNAAFLLGLGLTLTLPQAATSGSSQENPKAGASDAVPAYHAKAPQGELPETMNPDLFTDPVVKNAYMAAAKIKKTLYQQPCYCHCDKSKGHTSLLDCFASQHGSGCGTCIYEDLYSYEQLSKGKTAEQIREGIIKGEWKTVDAAKYQKPVSFK